MQAIKDKINDIKTMRKAKADAKVEDKAEKEFTKARLDVAHEVRLAKEAEASMDLHIAKASQKVDREIAKHGGLNSSYDPNIEDRDPGQIGIDLNPSAPAAQQADSHDNLTSGYKQNCKSAP